MIIIIIIRVSHAQSARGSQDGEGARVTSLDRKNKEKGLSDKLIPPIFPVNFILICCHLTQVLRCEMCVERGAKHGRELCTGSGDFLFLE